MGKYVLFSCQEQLFAAAIEEVEKIIPAEKPNRLPDTSRYVLGLIQFEERAIPVIDLADRLYQTPAAHEADTKIMVIHWRDSLIGLLVDDVKRVQDFQSAEQPADLEETGSYQFIQQVFRTEEELVMEVEMDQLLAGSAIDEIMLILNK